MLSALSFSEVDRAGTRVLTCRFAGRTCALPLVNIIETMRPLPIDTLAGAPAFVLGVAVVRGTPVPVVDARRLFGVPTGDATRWVTLRVASRMVALAVDSVVGVNMVPREELRELPPLLAHAAAGAIDALGTADSELLIVLQTARLVPDEVLAVELRGAAT